MQFIRGISNVVIFIQTIDNFPCCILYDLQLIKQFFMDAVVQTITVVKFTCNKAVYNKFQLLSPKYKSINIILHKEPVCTFQSVQCWLLGRLWALSSFL